MTFEPIVKVIAYITNADELLVFRHTQHPQAGIQVPGGTLEAEEEPQEAVLREAREETGLDRLKLQAYLGCDEICMEGFTPIRRCFYLLRFEGLPKRIWRHEELTPSDGSPGPIEFEFSWVHLAEAPALLSGNQGAMLKKLTLDEAGEVVVSKSAESQAMQDGSDCG